MEDDGASVGEAVEADAAGYSAVGDDEARNGKAVGVGVVGDDGVRVGEAVTISWSPHRLCSWRLSLLEVS